MIIAVRKTSQIFFILCCISLLASCTTVQTVTAKHQELIAKYEQSRMVINNDGTITQSFDGSNRTLMWIIDGRCLKINYPDIYKQNKWPLTDTIIFQQANEIIEDLNSGKYPECSFGYTDWRLPTMQELFNLTGFRDSIRRCSWNTYRGIGKLKDCDQTIRNINVAEFYWVEPETPEFEDKKWAFRFGQGGSLSEAAPILLPPDVNGPTDIFPVRDIR